MPTTPTLGDRVAKRRAELGLTQMQLAVECGCDQVTISKIERGVYVDVKKTMLEALALHLGLTLEELMTGKRQRSARGA